MKKTLVLFALLSQACVPGSDRPAGTLGAEGEPWLTSGVASDGSGAGEACDQEGASRTCHVQIPAGSGANDCFTATQTCTDGAWGPCGGEDEDDASQGDEDGLDATAAYAGALSIPGPSSAACDTNYCNFQCAGFAEVPAAPIKPACGSPLTYTQRYTSVCPAGQRGEWDLFSYRASAPSGTTIAFKIRTGSSTLGPFDPYVQVANAPLDHPAMCTMTGPSPCPASYGSGCSCPIDIYTPLHGYPDAEDPILDLSVTLTPSGCGAGAVISPGQGTTINGVTDCSNGAKNLASTSTVCSATTQYTACGQDFHCNLATKRCEWNVPMNYSDLACVGNGGVDLTTGVSCTDPGGVTHTSVCNRGSAALSASAQSPKTIEIGIANGVGSYDSCDQAGANIVCSQAITAPLAAGACIDITGCNAAQGNRFFTVNPRHLIPECGWSGGTGGGCWNNGAGERGGGGQCPETCGAPVPAAAPHLDSWNLTYSCVDSE